MKRILFILCVILFVSCITDEDRKSYPKPKYRVGDVVYMKPDSTKAIIYFYGGNDWNPCYALRYNDKNGVVHETGTGWSHSLISESELY